MSAQYYSHTVHADGSWWSWSRSRFRDYWWEKSELSQAYCFLLLTLHVIVHLPERVVSSASSAPVSAYLVPAAFPVLVRMFCLQLLEHFLVLCLTNFHQLSVSYQRQQLHSSLPFWFVYCLNNYVKCLYIVSVNATTML